jgi:hypothetical protein
MGSTRNRQKLSEPLDNGNDNGLDCIHFNMMVIKKAMIESSLFSLCIGKL